MSERELAGSKDSVEMAVAVGPFESVLVGSGCKSIEVVLVAETLVLQVSVTTTFVGVV